MIMKMLIRPAALLCATSCLADEPMQFKDARASGIAIGRYYGGKPWGARGVGAYATIAVVCKTSGLMTMSADGLASADFFGDTDTIIEFADGISETDIPGAVDFEVGMHMIFDLMAIKMSDARDHRDARLNGGTAEPFYTAANVDLGCAVAKNIAPQLFK